MIHMRNNSDHLGPHLNVFNALSQEMSKIAAGMPLEQLAEKLLLTRSKDSTGAICMSIPVYVRTGVRKEAVNMAEWRSPTY